MTKLNAISSQQYKLERGEGLTLTQYHRQSQDFAVYAHRGQNLTYPILALCGEAGELANRWKKILRVEKQPEYLDLMGIQDELGDVLWYCAAIADELGLTLEDVAKDNLTKLGLRYQKASSPPPNFSIGTTGEGDVTVTGKMVK